MQKKLFLGFLVLLITGIHNGVIAKTVEVLSLSNFSTANPPSEIKVRLLDELDLDNVKIKSGSVLAGTLTDVKSPKRLKRNAKFSFKLLWYIDDDGTKHIVQDDIKASYTTTLDGAQLAKNVTLSVGNHFVKGLKMGVAAVEGAIENEEDNRLKSSAKSLYNASPVSYIEKGNDLLIEENDIFYLKFPNKKTEKE